MDKYDKTALAVWLVWAIFCVAVAIGIIYVAVHFISKLW